MPADAPPPTPVVLRPAQPTDAPVLAALWESGWHDAHDGNVPDALSAARTAQSFVDRAPGLVPDTTVAVDGGRVVGFVTVHGDLVDQLYVDADARGRGVAAALLRHAATAAQADGLTELWLAVAPGNVRARRFYERQGWLDAGPLDHRVPAGDGTTLDVPTRRYTLTLGA